MPILERSAVIKVQKEGSEVEMDVEYHDGVSRFILIGTVCLFPWQRPKHVRLLFVGYSTQGDEVRAEAVLSRETFEKMAAHLFEAHEKECV